MSTGAFTRRRGWYHTNDIRTMTYNLDMEICIPKVGRGYSRENVEVVWNVWRNDDPKDECRV